LITIRDRVLELPKNNLEFDENDYKNLRLPSNNCFYKEYASFAFSYGGKYLGGWRRDRLGKRDYVAEAYRNALRQSPLLKGVILVNCDYTKLKIPKNSLIYCDPPYKNTTNYKYRFCHEQFYDWCRFQSKLGHYVFVSEYYCPEDFEEVFCKRLPSSLTANTGEKLGIEKLYKVKS